MNDNGSETVESMDDQIHTSPKTTGINPTTSNYNTVEINNTKLISNEILHKASNESARRSNRIKKTPDLYWATNNRKQINNKQLQRR